MNNPYLSTHEGETECRGCGEVADYGVRIQGTFHDIPLCRDCKEDLTCICPSCDQRIWDVRGYRIYATASKYCERCYKAHPAVAESVDADLRADEQADKFNDVRRG